MALRKMYIKKDEITKNENPIEHNGNKTNVYIGNYKGQDVAIKLSKNDQEMTRQEFYTYYRLRSSQNIIKCFGIMSLPNQNLSLIFEYASKGNLHDYLKSSSLTWEEKSKLLNELLLGLDYCHEKHILHLNLKLSNILVMDDGIIKLTDFTVKGGANKKDNVEKKDFEKDSLCWMAPERVCNDEDINSWFVKNPYLSDIYSCGLILWSVACDGMIPYENLDNENIEKEKSNVNTIQELNEKLPKDCPGNYIKVFNNLTKYNPEERCTLSTAVTDLQSTYEEVNEITEPLNSEQNMTESQLKINQKPQEQTEQQEENIQQQNLDSKKKNEEVLNQPRNSVSFPDLKNSAVEALIEQERKERRHSSAELIGDNTSKSFRRSGVSFYEHPININSKLINTSFFRSTPSPSPSSKMSAAPSVLTSTQQSITQSVNFQINFIEELFEFYQSQVRIDLNSFPKQLQYWLKSKQLDPTSLFDSVKNIPSQKYYESLLGILYENGIGTSQDKTLAFHCYTMGKDNGDPISKALLANAHLVGCGTKKNVKQAYLLLKKYSNEGNIWSQFMLAEYYYNNIISINCFGKKNLMLRDTSKEAFMWYMKSAQGGYINAEYKIGTCYKKGFGAIKSNLAAFQWYLKAAINGLMVAQYKVAKWYQDGGDDGKIGEKKDEDEAFRWYLRAASNRHEKAMKIVAEEYENGYHIDKDLGEAKRWYEQAFLLELDWAYAKLKQWCEQDIIKSNDPLYYDIMLRI